MMEDSQEEEVRFRHPRAPHTGAEIETQWYCVPDAGPQMSIYYGKEDAVWVHDDTGPIPAHDEVQMKTGTDGVRISEVPVTEGVAAAEAAAWTMYGDYALAMLREAAAHGYQGHEGAEIGAGVCLTVEGVKSAVGGT